MVSSLRNHRQSIIYIMLINTMYIIMKAIEATTDRARRRALRLIEAFLRCGAALTQQEQVLLGQLKRILDSNNKSDVPPVSPPDYEGWAPLGI